MKMLYDFFPVLFFFIAFKLFNIYIATAVAMAAACIQLIGYRIKHQAFEKMHVASFAMIMIFGAATLVFHDPVFIKWKPTAVYWMMSAAILGSHWWGTKPLIQRMMESNIDLPVMIWRRLNIAWASYFLFLGLLNVYVAYSYSMSFWVTFKLFGGMGLTLLFVFAQALYLTRHLMPSKAQ